MENQAFFLFDCQTTGTSPEKSYIVEAAWGIYSAIFEPDTWALACHRVSLPEGREIPPKIRRLTGLSEVAEDSSPLSYGELCAAFYQSWAASGFLPLLIHYAQFEKGFLQQMISYGNFERSPLTQLVCTHKLARHYLPALPSYSLRAIAGYLGYSLEECKRSTDHLRATSYIWQQLIPHLKPSYTGELGLLTWLQTIPRRRREAGVFESQISRSTRLALPTTCGVYLMKDGVGRVLYVGKANNLKARVNSYFRGRSSKGSRLNEMLVRVKEIDYIKVNSPLAALLKENDEIKRLDPAYNRQLRLSDRQVYGLSWDISPAARPWMKKMTGPFLGRGPYEFWHFIKELQGGAWQPLHRWGEEIEPQILQGGLRRLFADHGLSYTSLPSPDNWAELAGRIWPYRLAELRARNRYRYETFVENSGSSKAVKQDKEEDELEGETEKVEELAFEWTEESCARAYFKSLRHLCYQSYRARHYLRLMNCEALWQQGGGEWLWVKVCQGEVSLTLHRERPSMEGPTSFQRSYGDCAKTIDVTVYDRLAILYREWRKAATCHETIELRLGPRLRLDREQILDHFI